jgi:peptide/nickel transport system substrate-binding protein
MHAIDRQEMVDTLMYGFSAVAHSWLDPGQAAYKDVEDRLVVRYDYDPRKAGQVIRDLGIGTDQSGAFQMPDGSGPLPVEVMVSASQDINVKSALAVADYWQRLGLHVDRVVQPTQMSGSERRVYEATRKGFFLTRQGADVANLSRFYTSQVPTPENDYVGNNGPRYASREMDALLDKYYVSIPMNERVAVVGQIVNIISDQLVVMPLFYGAEPVVIGNRLTNVGARTSSASQAWNAYEWDVK